VIVGCYTMDLYCDCESDRHDHGEFPHQFIAHKYSQCKRQAQKEGWVFKRNGTDAVCPKCSRKTKGTPDA